MEGTVVWSLPMAKRNLAAMARALWVLYELSSIPPHWDMLDMPRVRWG